MQIMCLLGTTVHVRDVGHSVCKELWVMGGCNKLESLTNSLQVITRILKNKSQISGTFQLAEIFRNYVNPTVKYNKLITQHIFKRDSFLMLSP